MSGITSTLSIAKTAIAAQQYGLAVTGHNIANVNNPNYSLQNAEQINRTPAPYAGFLFGTGVDTSQIRQSVDQLLENRLTDEKSALSAFEEAESYMNILEGYFDENSDASITSVMTEFWNAWHDLSNNPLGSSERVAVYEKGRNFADRLNKANADMTGLAADIKNEIDAALTRINSISGQIADLNRQITGLEANRSANDLRDMRNGLLDELGDLIDIDTFEQDNGSIIVNAANGLTLVNGVDHYNLYKDRDRIMWQGSYGADVDITDRISGGKLAGWLDIRDEVLPKFVSELDVLAREMIWALNDQHAMGVGLDYFTGSVTGHYRADQSGLLSSYRFGDKIDYDQDFVMWMKDGSSTDPRYVRTRMDMGLSEATISNWQGSTAGSVQSRYRLTVMDGAELGEKTVMETDGAGLAQVASSVLSVTDALNTLLAEQTLTVNNGPSGTGVVRIRDAGGDARRSAASIAQALSSIDGVEAHASKVSATFDLTGLGDAEDGDEIRFSLYVDGLIHEKRFTLDSQDGSLSLDDQFQVALKQAADEINRIHDDLDLFADGLTLTSASGRTLGVQDFEVLDNAGIRMDQFIGFAAGDEITFTVESSGFGSSFPTSTQVSVNLNGVDAGDPAAVAAAFYEALKSGLSGEPFSVSHDPSTNAVILRTTDGSDLTLRDGDGALAGSLAITALSGTTPSAGDLQLVFDGSGDVETFDADTVNTDTIGFQGQGTVAVIEEVSAAGVRAGVIMGTVTILTNPGMTVFSNVAGPGGLFAGNWAPIGGSILTFGGDGGYQDFTTGNTVSFELDGTAVSFVVSGATDLSHATDLETALGALSPDYRVIRTGTSVSVLKTASLEEPMEITLFAETGDNDARLSVTIGTGIGTSSPRNDLLEAGNEYRDFATSSLFADEGIIKWEKLDENGFFTGVSGLLTVERPGTLSIVESGAVTLSFDVSAGSLVAGNTLTVNTNRSGSPDPLNFTVSGAANNKNEIYHFTVATGGKIGELVTDKADIITIEWQTATASGSFQLKGADPVQTPDTPIEVKLDGMTLKFFDGTLFKNDVFTITTDESGLPASFNESGRRTGESLSDWHWTQDSFAAQFNRESEGMRASVTLNNELRFETREDYYAVTRVDYSGKNGFNQDNTTITVRDWSAIHFKADDLQVVRSADGRWGLVNDPTGGNAVFIPEGGDDNGFGIDFSGDGLADLDIRFAKKVYGEGFVQMDFEAVGRSNLSFAFSDDSMTGSSGILAVAGINTFFNGYDAMTMEIDDRLADTRYVASARINAKTGEISQGDNTNALAMADIQYRDITMKQWNYDRGSDAVSSLTTTTLDGYYSRMIGSMGIISRKIKSSKEFADMLVKNLTEQRNAISAVSLDEEMIKLIKYQHGFSAASKLLTVSDEMLTTLISVR